MPSVEKQIPAESAEGQLQGQSVPTTGTQDPVLAPLPASASRQAFSQLARELTDKELAQPGATKLLLDHIDQLTAELEVYKGFRERYHEADKRAAVLEERMKSAKAVDIASGVMLAIGGIIGGRASEVWVTSWRAYCSSEAS